MKWDPAFESVSIKTTAQNGGDMMPSKSLRDELLDSVMDKYDHFEPDPIKNPDTNPVTNRSPMTQNAKKSSLKSSYESQGLDTTQLYVPKEQPRPSEKSKLVLENQPIPLDKTIPTYGRKGKKSYEEVQYNKEYQPPEFNDPGFVNKHVKFNDNESQPNIQKEKVDKPQSPRRSERIRNKSRTRWRPTKVAHALLGTMANVL